VRWDGAERSAGVRSTAGSKRGQQLPLGGSGCKADLGAGSGKDPERAIGRGAEALGETEARAEERRNELV
jgi:hypothetical protein